MTEKEITDIVSKIELEFENNTESLIDSYSDTGEWINIYNAINIVRKVLKDK